MAASGGYKPRCFMDIEIDGKAGNTFFSEQSKRAMVLINNICYFQFILDYLPKDFMTDLTVNRVFPEISF